MGTLKDNRVGEKGTNKYGLPMQIVKYENNKAVTVLFTEMGCTRKTSYYNFKRGRVYPPKAETEPIEADYDEGGNNIAIVASIVAVGTILFGVILCGIIELIKCLV